MRLSHSEACALARGIVAKQREHGWPQAARARRARMLDRLSPVILAGVHCGLWHDEWFVVRRDLRRLFNGLTFAVYDLFSATVNTHKQDARP